MFNENSIVARTWANAILKGDRELEEVPNISNLIAIVTVLVGEAEANV